MTDKELMQQALEALDGLSEPYDVLRIQTALRERLAQPEQEPVVWMYQDKSTHEVKFQKHMRGFVDHGATYETPLYTFPPQRTWVGLTAEEIARVVSLAGFAPDWAEAHIATQIVRVLEAKLKEKNT
jgi:hypothetical protein